MSGETSLLKEGDIRNTNFSQGLVTNIDQHELEHAHAQAKRKYL